MPPLFLLVCPILAVSRLLDTREQRPNGITRIVGFRYEAPRSQFNTDFHSGVMVEVGTAQWKVVQWLNA